MKLLNARNFDENHLVYCLFGPVSHTGSTSTTWIKEIALITLSTTSNAHEVVLSGDKVLCYHHHILSEHPRWGGGSQRFTHRPGKTSRVVHLCAVLGKIDG